ncbi:MAG TPA: hypothetical protein VGO58_15200 [Chitinophagaceae bacterium]|jgi:hypothetical protein|nr:hypothetical protein [Chitinophagaceae bacterium]
MPFEDFDKKIKEAADHHHPAYDEQAWTRMEKLLNKHLPQKEDNRRRFLFIILLFLGLGGGALLITKPWKKDRNDPIATKQPGKQTEVGPPVSTGSRYQKEPGTNNTASPVVENGDNPVGSADRNIPVAVTPAKAVTADNNTIGQYNNVISKTRTGNNRKDKTAPVSFIATINKDKPALAEEKNDWGSNTDVKKEEPARKNKDDMPVKTLDVAVEAAIGEKNKIDKAKTDDPVIKNDVKTAEKEITAKTGIKKDETVAITNTEKKAKEKKKKPGSFFFSMSAGPDLSFVKNNKAGDVKLLTGIGLGYNYKDRLTIRTGFYSARKVYTAGPDAYDPPAGFSALYPYLEKVDANCKVYEIPVSVSYNFGNRSSKNFFVSAGLSTFLMNEETYNYHYKYTPLGNTYTNEWTIKNKNSHFFSVATVSAGYRKEVGKRVTLIAEPYFKIPLGGVGYGKVKLNSGGVLFTIGIKPF